VHSCPECGYACFCGGDIDDIDWGEDSEEAMACTHCQADGGDSGDDWDEIYDDYVEEYP
jgi:hypothetical protein